MFVSFRLLMVESVLFTSATVRPIKGSVRAARFDDFAPRVDGVKGLMVASSISRIKKIIFFGFQ